MYRDENKNLIYPDYEVAEFSYSAYLDNFRSEYRYYVTDDYSKIKQIVDVQKGEYPYLMINKMSHIAKSGKQRQLMLGYYPSAITIFYWAVKNDELINSGVMSLLANQGKAINISALEELYILPIGNLKVIQPVYPSGN